jgi:hypothetical protein
VVEFLLSQEVYTVILNNIKSEDNNVEASCAKAKLYGKTYLYCYFTLSSNAENYVSSFKLFETHKCIQNKNRII